MLPKGSTRFCSGIPKLTLCATVVLYRVSAPSFVFQAVLMSRIIGTVLVGNL